MREQLRDLVLLLREVADSGALDIDARLDYVEVQVDRDTWNRVQAYRSLPLASPCPAPGAARNEDNQG